MDHAGSKKGTFSIFYTYMTTDREEVRAVIGLPPKGVEDVQVSARLEMPSGQIVGQGTVSIWQSFGADLYTLY